LFPFAVSWLTPLPSVQHMMIRKNFGCTHFIIGRDMAGSKSSITGDDFYGAYDAQDFAKKHGPELGMTPVPSLNLVYTEEKDYVTAEQAKEEGLNEKKLSGTKFRQARLPAALILPSIPPHLTHQLTHSFTLCHLLILTPSSSIPFDPCLLPHTCVA
jgi:ATP sulfurylase